MGQSEQNGTCAMVCKVIAVVIAIILFFIMNAGMSFVLSLILAVIAGVLLWLLLPKVFCGGKHGVYADTPAAPAPMSDPEPMPSAPAAEAESAPVAEPEPTPEPAPEPVAPAPVAEAAPEAAEEEAAAAEGEASGPEVLTAARDGNADDLKKIKGVGPQLEKTLNELGFFHFDQIAAWTDADVEWVDSRLKFKGRITRDDWIGQAKELAGN